MEEFAADNAVWLEAFGQAFQIIIENGYETGDLVEACDLAEASGTTNRAPLLITATAFAVTAILSLPY